MSGSLRIGLVGEGGWLGGAIAGSILDARLYGLRVHKSNLILVDETTRSMPTINTQPETIWLNLTDAEIAGF